MTKFKKFHLMKSTVFFGIKGSMIITVQCWDSICELGLLLLKEGHFLLCSARYKYGRKQVVKKWE